MEEEEKRGSEGTRYEGLREKKKNAGPSPSVFSFF